nr:immunoglobulin light chain junction region [Macaca mulatta]
DYYCVVWHNNVWEF